MKLEIDWQCEYCESVFKTQAECEEHESQCRCTNNEPEKDGLSGWGASPDTPRGTENESESNEFREKELRNRQKGGMGKKADFPIPGPEAYFKDFNTTSPQ